MQKSQLHKLGLKWQLCRTNAGHATQMQNAGLQINYMVSELAFFHTPKALTVSLVETDAFI